MKSKGTMKDTQTLWYDGSCWTTEGWAVDIDEITGDLIKFRYHGSTRPLFGRIPRQWPDRIDIDRMRAKDYHWLRKNKP